jgi:hypothetical protein
MGFALTTHSDADACIYGIRAPLNTCCIEFSRVSERNMCLVDKANVFVVENSSSFSVGWYDSGKLYETTKKWLFLSSLMLNRNDLLLDKLYNLRARIESSGQRLLSLDEISVRIKEDRREYDV